MIFFVAVEHMYPNDSDGLAGDSRFARKYKIYCK